MRHVLGGDTNAMRLGAWLLPPPTSLIILQFGQQSSDTRKCQQRQGATIMGVSCSPNSGQKTGRDALGDDHGPCVRQ